MEDYSNQNGHSGYDPKYNPQSYGPNYDYGSYGNDPYGEGGPNKSVKGLKIMIVIMALILAALSAIYFLQADSLLDKLQKERRLSYSKIRNYEKQMSYMRTVMEGYIRQIDSLDRINKKLVNENTTIRKMITTYKLRAETAEEKSQELSTKVRQGAVIRARDIRLLALSKSDREVSRASRAERLRVDLVLVGNELAEPGERTVYVQIIGPDGYVLANASNALFDFEGDKITFSAARQVDYQNNDLSVSLFYNGSGITSGKYRVKIYTDGNLIGSNEIILR